MLKESTDQLDVILASVFGKEGTSQDDIPKNMKVGSLKNPAVQVFGDGVWLQDQPGNGLNDWAEKIGKQMVGWLSLFLFFHTDEVAETSDLLGRSEQVERNPSSPS